MIAVLLHVDIVSSLAKLECCKLVLVYNERYRNSTFISPSNSVYKIDNIVLDSIEIYTKSFCEVFPYKECRPLGCDAMWLL
jgi:hypothetical protein